MKPHKWAKEIIHWANGGEIEQRNECIGINWMEFSSWALEDSHWEYRIKPQPEPDAFVGAFVYKLATGEIKLFDSFQHGEKLLGVTKIKLERE